MSEEDQSGTGGGTERTAKTYRGLTFKQAIRYLENMDGTRVAETRVVGDEWTADLSTETVTLGPTLTLTELTIVFESDPGTLDRIVERFNQKALRAPG